MRAVILISGIMALLIPGCGSDIYPESGHGGEYPTSRRVIYKEEIYKALVKEIGIYSEYAIYFSDPDYLEYRLFEVEEFLRRDDVDQKTYYRSYYDCDDFVISLAGRMKDFMPGAPIGIIYYAYIDGNRLKGHAQCVFYDGFEGNIYFIEPQWDDVEDDGGVFATSMVLFKRAGDQHE